MQLAAGVIGALVAIPPHLGEETVFPTVDEEGYLHHSRLTHHLDTTTDFARKSVFANWMLGGLNTHVIHHLFPNICHAHYIPLTQILKDTMDEAGIDLKHRADSGTLPFDEQLRRLDSLKRDGLITEEEFAAARQKILDSLGA